MFLVTNEKYGTLSIYANPSIWICISVFLDFTDPNVQPVQAASRHPTLYGVLRITCTTWTASLASSATGRWTRGTSSTWWRTRNCSARLTMSQQKPEKVNQILQIWLSSCKRSRREVASLTERKSPTHLQNLSKNLSVCLSVTNFDLNYFRTGLTEWAKKL